ncbi:oligopeptide/dipeptide ABC transporter ATP-binding protein [Tritonibacter mobilis]|uniref:oligopeptide/dipeptide ABC transporter ATP-binding protein n=1 Tax=Tritonibacter mobilis TaxID=379347 RepID=UPI0039A72C15
MAWLREWELSKDPMAERAKRIMPMVGDMPSPMNPPSGCVFRGRCPRAQDDCAQIVPQPNTGAHATACLHPVPQYSGETT